MIDIRQGDCREQMAAMPAGSVDAIVTDPPYGLGFMGVKWDTYGDGKGCGPSPGVDFDQVGGNSHARKPGGVELIRMKENRKFGAWSEEWATEALRVAKPGAHIVAFGGTRTYHRLACAIEDAGWEIRDCLMWLYGQGFPKSLDVSKAIDKAAEAERESARQWSGWGTALKPAWEPIILARKPLAGTVAANVQEHGTGALNVDGCRVATEGGSPSIARRAAGAPSSCRPGEYGDTIVNRITPERYEETRPGEALGRWPANVVLDEDAARMLDEQSGELTSGTAVGGLHRRSNKTANCYGRFEGQRTEGDVCFGDTGGASRFFYTAKASSGERHAMGKNTHPTVKPVDLMRWLCRLVTPPGGLILDPFCGSGSTGVAALAEGFRFIGCELNPEYVQMAQRRIAGPLFAGLNCPKG